MEHLRDRFVYHFTERHNYERAQVEGSFTLPSLKSEGFIHCSKDSQVVRIANAIARNWEDVLLLKIETSRLSAALVYENTEGGQELFPHVYGPIDLEAIVEAKDFGRDAAGGYVFPY